MLAYLIVKANFSAAVMGSLTLLQEEVVTSSSMRFKTKENLSRVNLKYCWNLSSSSIRWLLIKLLKIPSFFRFLNTLLTSFLTFTNFVIMNSSSWSSSIISLSNIATRIFLFLQSVISILWNCKLMGYSYVNCTLLGKHFHAA